MGKPIEVEIDATLCKLSAAKPGDVLVIRADNLSDGLKFARALSECKLPPGLLPKIPLFVCGGGVEWSFEPGKGHDGSDS